MVSIALAAIREVADKGTPEDLEYLAEELEMLIPQNECDATEVDLY